MNFVLKVNFIVLLKSSVSVSEEHILYNIT